MVAPEENLFSGKFRKPILYAVLLAMFNQLSGINAILYYAPRIFEMAGFDKAQSYLQPVYIGGANLFFTFLAMTIIDKVGRKTLLITGAIGMIIFLALTACAFHNTGHANQYGDCLPHGFHCIFCILPGSRDLGIHFRNISKFRSLAGRFTGQFYPLDHGCHYLLDLPDYSGRKPQRRILFLYFLQPDDARLPDLYLARDAGNEGTDTGADSEGFGDCLSWLTVNGHPSTVNQIKYFRQPCRLK